MASRSSSRTSRATSTSCATIATGIVFPVGDAVALADCLERLVADEAARARLGKAARATVEAEYDLDVVVGSYVALYEELTSPLVGRA